MRLGKDTTQYVLINFVVLAITLPIGFLLGGPFGFVVALLLSPLLIYPLCRWAVSPDLDADFSEKFELPKSVARSQDTHGKKNAQELVKEVEKKAGLSSELESGDVFVPPEAIFPTPMRGQGGHSRFR